MWLLIGVGGESDIAAQLRGFPGWRPEIAGSGWVLSDGVR